MKTIIISDLHIGDIRHQAGHDRTLNMLKKQDFDCLILNGDIIDLWVDNINNIKQHCLFQYLCFLASIKKVIWVVGNHDDDVRYFPDIMPGAALCNYHIIERPERVMALHGNYFYVYENMAWYSKMACKFNFWLWKLTKSLGKRWNYAGLDMQSIIFRKGFWYEKEVLKKRKEILKRYSDSADIIVMGHTHLVGCYSDNNGMLYDGGSTAITSTYIEVDNNHVTIRKF